MKFSVRIIAMLMCLPLVVGCYNPGHQTYIPTDIPYGYPEKIDSAELYDSHAGKYESFLVRKEPIGSGEFKDDTLGVGYTEFSDHNAKEVSFHIPVKLLSFLVDSQTDKDALENSLDTVVIKSNYIIRRWVSTAAPTLTRYEYFIESAKDEYSCTIGSQQWRFVFDFHRETGPNKKFEDYWQNIVHEYPVVGIGMYTIQILKDEELVSNGNDAGIGVSFLGDWL